jgi:hypothetical protein
VHGLSPSDLLRVWEQGVHEDAVARALTMLESAYPGMQREELATLRIGRRDQDLLKLRAQTLGAEASALAKCPDCQEVLELILDTSELRAEVEGNPDDSFSITAEGVDVVFRLPNSLDLEAILGETDLPSARQALLQRCVLTPGPEALTDYAQSAVSERMGQLDPTSDVQLALTCPSCGHGWLAGFDVSSFFWNEIDVWAQRIVREVHALASSYGWREADILAMSPARRRLYLELAG